ncbi:hypothetical protein [Arthrobacter sp. A5]|uniref:hypothetical protein n=1 Tax=Arthrobacter sp. A5 TaxID=576926 RepID=UPI003DA937F5
MGWDWRAINSTLDDVSITVGIAIMIVRQFIWRSAQLHRMMRLPLIVICLGIVYLVSELWEGFRWVLGDWLIVGELVLVSITGTAMGFVTRFRTAGANLQYRLTGIGLILWGVFIAIRIGFFTLAELLGANLLYATGLILLSFGVNRLAAILVVRRRTREILNPNRGPARPFRASS